MTLQKDNNGWKSTPPKPLPSFFEKSEKVVIHKPKDIDSSVLIVIAENNEV